MLLSTTASCVLYEATIPELGGHVQYILWILHEYKVGGDFTWKHERVFSPAHSSHPISFLYISSVTNTAVTFFSFPPQANLLPAEPQ